MAESVDAADLKSVGIYPVPVQVWPSAPIKPPFGEVFCVHKVRLELARVPVRKKVKFSEYSQIMQILLERLKIW